jgi:predicted phage terminase large subunit-like protein
VVSLGGAHGLLTPDPAHIATQRYTQVTAETCRRDLRKFIRKAWHLVDPKPFTPSWHIDAIAEHLAYVTLGDIKQLMINIPPRMTKSSLVSVCWPAWWWADQPEMQFLTASYAADLANQDAQKMRRLIESDWYQLRFGDSVTLLQDENRINRFANTRGGHRISISVGSKTTGLGGDVHILDDPHNAMQVESDTIRRSTIQWHDGAFRSRFNDPNKARRVYVGQRTHDSDIFGHILAREEKNWVHLCLPMEFDPGRRCVTFRNRGKGPEGEPIFRDPRVKPNSLLCPDRFDANTAQAEKEGTTARVWNAQYQQQPEGAGGLILKRGWWRRWEWPEWHNDYRSKERPLPEFVEIIQAYDTAFEEGEQDSFTVRTTWGIFYQREMKEGKNGKIAYGDERVNAMLLERMKRRLGFPELREDAMEAYKIFKPDRILIEKKASGHDLIKELRRKGLPIVPVKVVGDLVYRAHMSSLPLEKGAVWYVNRNWAIDLIEECAKFPNSDFNDQVSSTTIALQYMRRYMDLQLSDEMLDSEDGISLFSPKIVRRESIYG